MKAMAAAIFFFLAATTPAWAGLSHAELASVAASPPARARLDPSLWAQDASGQTRNIGEMLAGRIGFVIFVDYSCKTLCGTELMLLSHALQQSHVVTGTYRILVIGIDPKDTARSAREMEREELGPAFWPDTVLLLPEKESLQLMTQSLGFHYAYDASIDQFAHPATVYVVAQDGAVRTALSPFALTIADMTAVVRNSSTSPAPWERMRLLCYAYDPATGVYTFRIMLLLRVAALLTLFALATGVFLLTWRGRSAT